MILIFYFPHESGRLIPSFDRLLFRLLFQTASQFISRLHNSIKTNEPGGGAHLHLSAGKFRFHPRAFPLASLIAHCLSL